VNSFTTEPFIEWNRVIREKREKLWSKAEWIFFVAVIYVLGINFY
jgi:hypothetical protein